MADIRPGRGQTSTDAMDVLPHCAICLERLGTYGGPVSLPCGHNGCRDCFSAVQASKAECPLCRAAFSGDANLSINRDLQSLMDASTGSICHGPGNRYLSQDSDEGENFSNWQFVGAEQALPPYLLSGHSREGSANAPSTSDPAPSAPPAPQGIRDWFLQAIGPEEAQALAHGPPVWQPDSSSSACGLCSSRFTLFLPRHHCRMCGGIFCHACSKARLLMPPKFLQPKPERTCRACAEFLLPLQPMLAEACSPAGRQALYDVLDWSVPRALFNAPYLQPLELEIFKCTNILQSAAQSNIWTKGLLKQQALREAKGLVIISTVKAGMGWSFSFGSGLIIRRLSRGRWSPPAGIGSVSLGWGLQGGAQVADLVLVIRTDEALQRLCGGFVGDVCGGAGIALGGIGLQGLADMIAAYSVSKSRGAYAGISMEGTAFFSRPCANHAFYGQKLSTRQLLFEQATPPTLACKPLFNALATFGADGVTQGTPS